jgi:hypothetical protein
MPFEKGRKKTGGITKGTPRKQTQLLTEMIDNALVKLGGEKYLVEQGKKNPQAFMSLVGKRLPKDMTIGGQLDLTLKVTRKFVKAIGQIKDGGN